MNRRTGEGQHRARPAPTAGAGRGGAGEVRIIGGQWKRSRLPVPVRPGLRPTPDRVRETVFNWLGQTLTGWRCLDAFAGSGALGLEAASRAAAEVLLLEQDPALVRQLRAHVERLGAQTVQVRQCSAFDWMRQAVPGQWDLVFLDPPFGDGSRAVFEQALSAARPLLAEQGLIYLEAPQAWSDADLLPWGLQGWRQGRAGMVHFHLLRPLDVAQD